MPLLQVVEEMHSLLQLVLQHKQEQEIPLQAAKMEYLLVEQAQLMTTMRQQTAMHKAFLYFGQILKKY
jgi:hypothetical protein